MLVGDAVYPRTTEVVLQDLTNHSSTVPDDAEPAPDAAIDDVRLRQLDPKAIPLWRVSLAGRGTFFAAALLAAELLASHLLLTGVLSGAVALITAILVWAIPPLRFRRWRFALEDEQLRLTHGVLFRTTSLVPYARIQHVDTRHGPIERWLGLASLVVFTAGTRGAILTIPALAADGAEEIRDRLAALSGAGDAV